MRTILARYWGSEGIRATGLVALGNVLSTGLGAIAMILIFRLLAPSDFGIFSAIFALMMVGAKFADFGTNIALQRTIAQPDSHVSPADKASIWSLTLVFKLTIALVIALLGYFTSPYLSSILHLDPIYVRAGLIAVSGMIIYDQALITAQAMHRFGISVGLSALQSVIKIAGIAILHFFYTINPITLIYLYGLAPLIGSLLIPLTLKLPLGKITWSKSSKSIIKIAKWTSLAIISAALADNLDVLMIQSLLDSVGTGIYASGARIAGFVAIVSYAIGVVLNVRVAKYKTKEHLKRYLKKANKLALASFIIMLFSTVFARALILITAGPEYLAATSSLQLLLVATGIVMATSPYVALFYTFDRPQYFAYSGILVAIALLAGNYLLIPLYGIEGAAVSKLATRTLGFIYTYYYAQRIYHEEY